MKRMCAWCGLDLNQVEECEEMPVTHGLCPACRRQFFVTAKDTVQVALPEPAAAANEPAAPQANLQIVRQHDIP